MTTLADKQEFRALVVDDDAVVRRMVSFALQQEGFQCDTAIDGEEALTRLREEHYDLLVTDLCMPNKHGHSLAVEVLAGDSHPTIIVHSSVDDPRLTKDLIVRGVDDVIYKPTDYKTFAAKAMGLVLRSNQKKEKQLNVELVVEKKSRDEADTQDDANAGNAPIDIAEMKLRLSDVSKVLPVPHAALDVFNMVGSGEFDADEVATAVQRDPSIAAKVLQLANSPFYNSTNKRVTDLKEAVTRIGQKRVGELALAMSVLSSLTPESLPWMDLDLAWQRCLAAGVAVELLMKQGKHTSISEGLTFSALMNSAGRTVLGTYYPKRYERMVAECTEKNEPLVRHEESCFPKNHAEVMCTLLADWNIPGEVYEPLKLILNDYPSLSTLREPLRTKVELVKLAILLGQIAAGKWESWDLIELPPQQVLERLGINDIGTIIEQSAAQLPAVANFRSAAQDKAHHPRFEPLQISYCNLSREQIDLLAEILPAMGIEVTPAEFKNGKVHGSALVNRIGAAPSQSTARSFVNCDQVVFVRDKAQMTRARKIGTNIGLPCSYAALRSACRKVGRFESEV